MPTVERIRPVVERDIELDKEGRILKFEELKRKIFRGVCYF